VKGSRGFVSLGEVSEVEQPAKSGDDRGVVVHRVINDPTRDVGRHDYGRRAHPELVEREAMGAVAGVSRAIAGRDRGRRRNMVVESAVLVVDDHQQALLPVAGGSDGFVDILDQPLATRYVVERVLGVATLEVAAVEEDVPVVRLDEDVGLRELLRGYSFADVING